MTIEQRLRFFAAEDLRRAVSVAPDGKLRRLDLTECQLARKQLDACFLRRVTRRQARRAAGTIAAVGELLR